MLINIQHISSCDKYPKRINIDRNESHISMLIISNTYQVDKYPTHIKLIEIGGISVLINIQDISS